ncbi:Site-specific recombinase XerD [Sulfitobacter brevis]|uniref:Site-specific recombinase XerD n=1 Tax=Sulfitobacter brevis TaxID=74348 RepID=A0A1I2GKC2_9RHOB|nr:site-specific integrase [Sulfitobacter brevis]SFF17176.1 Site-specific recombinase XerD [Sulfitobacter brevis]
MQRELTDRYLKSLKAPPTGRLEVSDTKRAGLRFRLTASGRATWMFEKRVKGGSKRKHTLGGWPEPVSLSQARALALELEAEAARGIDRVAIAEAERLDAETAKSKALSVRQVLELYDRLHLSGLRRGSERKRQIEQALQPRLGDPMGSLTRADLQKPIDEKASAGRGVFANRIRSALMAFTGWAADRDHLETDIGLRLTKPTKEASRERAPTRSEVHAIWNATFDLGDLWGPALRLLILTAQRRQEIFGLEWSEIDFDAATITKPGARTKNGREHVTHLSPPALSELRELRGKTDRQPQSLVFTTTGKTPVSGISKVKTRLDKLLGDDFEPWRLHDIRTAFATAMVERGVPENVADRVLNHSAVGSAPSSVARVYNRANMLSQRAQALDRWAEIVTGKVSPVVFLEAGSV